MVIAADSRVTSDLTLVSEEIAIRDSDIIVICTPHDEYKTLDYCGKPVFDIWNILERGNLIHVAKD